MINWSSVYHNADSRKIPLYDISILGTLPFYPQHGWQPFRYDDCSSQSSFNCSSHRLFDCSSQNLFVNLVVAGHWKFFCKDTNKFWDKQILGRLFLDYFQAIQVRQHSVTLLHRYIVTFGKFVCSTVTSVYILSILI